MSASHRDIGRVFRADSARTSRRLRRHWGKITGVAVAALLASYLRSAPCGSGPRSLEPSAIRKWKDGEIKHSPRHLFASKICVRLLPRRRWPRGHLRRVARRRDGIPTSRPDPYPPPLRAPTALVGSRTRPRCGCSPTSALPFRTMGEGFYAVGRGPARPADQGRLFRASVSTAETIPLSSGTVGGKVEDRGRLLLYRSKRGPLRRQGLGPTGRSPSTEDSRKCPRCRLGLGPGASLAFFPRFDIESIVTDLDNGVMHVVSGGRAGLNTFIRFSRDGSTVFHDVVHMDAKSLQGTEVYSGRPDVGLQLSYEHAEVPASPGRRRATVLLLGHGSCSSSNSPPGYRWRLVRVGNP